LREIISGARRSRHSEEKPAPPLYAGSWRSPVKSAARGRTASQVADASHVQPRGRLPQRLSTCGKESAVHSPGSRCCTFPDSHNRRSANPLRSSSTFAPFRV
jgi:hypothetical protein